jgi:hypothetical protein
MWLDLVLRPCLYLKEDKATILPTKLIILNRSKQYHCSFHSYSSLKAHVCENIAQVCALVALREMQNDVFEPKTDHTFTPHGHDIHEQKLTAHYVV